MANIISMFIYNSSIILIEPLILQEMVFFVIVEEIIYVKLILAKSAFCFPRYSFGHFPHYLLRASAV